MQNEMCRKGTRGGINTLISAGAAQCFFSVASRCKFGGGKFGRLFLLVCLLLAPLEAFCAEGVPLKRVAVLPFAVHAALNLSYLQDGIRSMMASRLAAGAGVEVVDRRKVESVLPVDNDGNWEKDWQGLAVKVGADYLLTGSVTAMGGGFSLDARVYDLAEPEKTGNFSAIAEREDELIAIIDKLTWDIAGQIFDHKPENISSQTKTIVSTESESDFHLQTTHPDRVFMTPAGPEKATVKSENVVGSGIVTKAGLPIASPVGAAFTKSKDFEIDLQAMGVGDIDGDGKPEVVIAARSELFVFSIASGTFTKFGGLDLPSRFVIHGVYLADLNKNGKDEIYFSTTDGWNPDGSAVEWDGHGFAYIFKEKPWYIKILDIPGEGLVLIGQKGGLDSPIAAGIFRLTMKDDKVVVGEKLAVPDAINLFDFALVDLDQDGTMEVVAVDQDDRLRVIRSDGKMLWRSSERYGGVTRYIGGRKDDFESPESSEDTDIRIYVPSRIIISDLNGDGRLEVVINRNLSSASRILPKMKSYPDGELTGLSWNGISLVQIWGTGKIDGYIADYQLLPSVDGVARLFVGLVLQRGWLDKLSGPETTVLMYDLVQTGTVKGN